MKHTNSAIKTGWWFVFWQFFFAAVILLLAHFEMKIIGNKMVNLAGIELTRILEVTGIILLIISILVFFIAVISFRQLITPNPVPRDEAKLVKNGIYAYIRHPMYLFGILLTFGYVLYKSAFFTLILCIFYIVFFIYKIKFEENHLIKRFPEYSTYRESTKKLLPFVY